MIAKADPAPTEPIDADALKLALKRAAAMIPRPITDETAATYSHAFLILSALMQTPRHGLTDLEGADRDRATGIACDVAAELAPQIAAAVQKHLEG